MSPLFGYLVGEHLLISLVPWLVGCVVGVGLGYACALAARNLFSRRPGLRGVSMLLPWRTVIVVWVLASLSPLVPVLVGLGMFAGGTMVALLVFLLALPFTASTLLGHWFPPVLLVRLVGGFRILAIAAVMATIFVSAVAGSGGAGALIFREGWLLADYVEVLVGLAIVILLSLSIDVLFGILQYLLGRAPRPDRGRFRTSNHATPMSPGCG